MCSPRCHEPEGTRETAIAGLGQFEIFCTPFHSLDEAEEFAATLSGESLKVKVTHNLADNTACVYSIGPGAEFELLDGQVITADKPGPYDPSVDRHEFRAG